MVQHDDFAKIKVRGKDMFSVYLLCVVLRNN
jgi:hypothetical protein